MQYIMSVETIKIKDFLFSTNKLKCIQGASYLLDYINNIGIRKILEKYGVKTPKISYKEIENIFKNSNNIEKDLYEKLKDNDVFYIAAGNAKFIIREEHNLLNIKNEIEKMYEVLLPGSKVVIGYETISDGVLYSNIISALAQKTNEQKSIYSFIDNLDLPYIKKCALSNREDAEISINDLSSKEKLLKIIYPLFSLGGKKEFVFEEILDKIYSKIHLDVLKNQLNNLIDISKEYVSRATMLKIIFSNLLKDADEEISFYSQVLKKFPNIDENMSIEEYPIDKSFIGFMYSDGDGLGEHIKNSTLNKTNNEYLIFIKPFSIILDYITRSSLIDALDNIIEDKNSKKVGAFFIVGGDDVCALFDAPTAIKVSAKYSEIFSNKMKKVKYDNISTSNGLLISKAKVPIFLMMRQALNLQKSAKSKRYEKKSNKGYIDFQNIGQEGLVNISNYRKDKLNVLNRPYENTDFIKLINNIRELSKNKIPKNKLRTFYDILVNKVDLLQEKNMKILNLIFKINNQELIKNIWNEFSNNEVDIIFGKMNICRDILDIIELYDFINMKEGK